jgi:hypothetical protein
MRRHQSQTRSAPRKRSGAAFKPHSPSRSKQNSENSSPLDNHPKQTCAKDTPLLKDITKVAGKCVRPRVITPAHEFLNPGSIWVRNILPDSRLGRRKVWPRLARFSRNRTKMFHVKHFGTIDGLRKRPFGARATIRIRDLAQAEERGRVYFLIYSSLAPPTASSASLR